MGRERERKKPNRKKLAQVINECDTNRFVFFSISLSKYKHRALRLTFDTISSVAKTNSGTKREKKKQEVDRFLNQTSAEKKPFLINKLCRRVNKEKNAK